MKDCVSPNGHSWRATSFRIAAGSTPVVCTNEGCDEQGYMLDNASGRVVDQSPGQEGEELF